MTLIVIGDRMAFPLHDIQGVAVLAPGELELAIAGRLKGFRIKADFEEFLKLWLDPDDRIVRFEEA